MGLELKVIAIDKPAETNLILGQSHFIKTVEDLYEALVGSVPGIKFGSPSARPRARASSGPRARTRP